MTFVVSERLLVGIGVVLFVTKLNAALGAMERLRPRAGNPHSTKRGWQSRIQMSGTGSLNCAGSRCRQIYLSARESYSMTLHIELQPLVSLWLQKGTMLQDTTSSQESEFLRWTVYFPNRQRNDEDCAV